MKKLGTTLLILLFAVSLGVTDGLAHTRRYVFNQEYRTIPQGMFEIENWVKFKVPNRQKSNVRTWEYEEELEYGLTDRFTIANYHTWETKNKKGPDDSTVYKGFKIEAKYRIGEKGKYWVDPLLYFEWKREVRAKNENVFESKLILSKDFGKLNLNYNQIMENQLGSGGRTAQQFTVGTNYEFPHDIHVGVEAKGDYWRPGSHRNRISLGPALAWEGKYFWVAASLLFGLNRAADDFEARAIVGIPLPFDSSSFLKKLSGDKSNAA